jgi:hypothetical protein
MSEPVTTIKHCNSYRHFSSAIEGGVYTDDDGQEWRAGRHGWELVGGVCGIDMKPAMEPVLCTIPDGVANPKHAAGSAKVPMHLVPMTAIVYEALVFQLGAKKYGPMNWRQTEVVRSIYLDAAMRHLAALMDGQDLDEESGLPHEAHVRACMAIIMDARELGKLIDDRDTPGPVADVLRKTVKQV